MILLRPGLNQLAGGYGEGAGGVQDFLVELQPLALERSCHVIKVTGVRVQVHGSVRSEEVRVVRAAVQVQMAFGHYLRSGLVVGGPVGLDHIVPVVDYHLADKRVEIGRRSFHVALRLRLDLYRNAGRRGRNYVRHRDGIGWRGLIWGVGILRGAGSLRTAQLSRSHRGKLPRYCLGPKLQMTQHEQRGKQKSTGSHREGQPKNSKAPLPGSDPAKARCSGSTNRFSHPYWSWNTCIDACASMRVSAASSSCPQLLTKTRMRFFPEAFRVRLPQEMRISVEHFASNC